MIYLLRVEAALFFLTMFLVLRKPDQVWGEYCGIFFHVGLLPIIFGVAPSPFNYISGSQWVAFDLLASLGTLWCWPVKEAEGKIFLAIRMTGHLFAAAWIGSVSLALNNIYVLLIGLFLAAVFFAYAIAAGRMPKRFQGVGVPLLGAWLLGISFL